LPDTAAALSRLSGFDASEWTAWIDHFVNGTPVAPAVSRGKDPPHLALNAIYDQLPESAKAAFSNGLAALLPSAQPAPDGGNTPRIYSLLQVAAHVAPSAAKAVLLSRLTSQAMRGLSYAGWDLHALLLVACSQFGVDEKLSDYIFHSVESIRDFDYLVICFRMLLKRGPEITPFLLLESMLPFLGNPDNSDRLGEVLDEALYRNGAWHLLCWFADVAPRLKERGTEGLDSLEKIALQTVPWPDNPKVAEPSMLMLAAWVQAPVRKFAASDIAALLDVLHRSYQTEAGQRLRVVMDRLGYYDPELIFVDGQDETAPSNRLEGSGDFIRVISSGEANRQVEEKVPRTDFNREIAHQHGRLRRRGLRNKPHQSRLAGRYV
jgi:hypothetical protein